MVNIDSIEGVVASYADKLKADKTSFDPERCRHCSFRLSKLTVPCIKMKVGF
jgi:hypothetical protein